MRKVIKRPDGTEEVVEGTAEEIAEYERQIREGGKPQTSKKKPVLHGAEVDGKPLTDEEITMIRLARAGLLPKEKEVIRDPVYIPQFVPYRFEPEACWICGQKNCRQMHIWCRTETVTSDNTLTPKLALPTLAEIAAGATFEVHCNHEPPPGFGTYEMYPKH